MIVETEQFIGQFRAMARDSRAQGRRLAVWGAGGRCVALLALVQAQDLGIAYVVDSDPRKWGRFTPVTHLPVVGPEALQRDPVHDLVIAATAFQDEIVQQLAWFASAGGRLGVLQPEPRWINEAEVGQHVAVG
jgi:FlaA1/EpsC-like NDP-sugar epimerase